MSQTVTMETVHISNCYHRKTVHVLTVSISGMEGGEAPSVADYFVVAGLDDNVTLLQPPEYVSIHTLKHENTICFQ